MKVAASTITETMKVVALTTTEAIIREEVRDVRRVTGRPAGRKL